MITACNDASRAISDSVAEAINTCVPADYVTPLIQLVHANLVRWDDDFYGRWYVRHGEDLYEPYASVNQVIRWTTPEANALRRWKMRNPDNVTAADAGSYQHKRIEEAVRAMIITNGKDYDKRERQHSPFYYIDQFFEEQGLIPLVPELTITHRTLRYAGTIDLLCWQSATKSLVILDWKTGKKRPSHKVQQEFYIEALRTWLPAYALPSIRAHICTVDGDGFRIKMHEPIGPLGNRVQERMSFITDPDVWEAIVPPKGDFHFELYK